MKPEGDVALRQRVADFLREAAPLLALERVARGAGSTRWWVLREMPDFDAVSAEFRPGSRVHLLPFGEDVRLVAVAEGIAEDVREFSRSHDDWFIGTLGRDGREVELQWLARDELDAALAELSPGELLMYGTFPATDGPGSITFTPPDADGVVRPQPV